MATVAVDGAVPGRGRAARFSLEWGGVAVAVIILTALLRAFVAQAFYIPSGSMLPQLQLDDRIVVSKLAYHLHDPRRGDIVVFDAPPGEPGATKSDGGGALPARVGRALLEGVNVVKPQRTEYVKRVIGLPGDSVMARDGAVYVNGRRLVEPYLPTGVRTLRLDTPVVVPAGHLFVMGDNRGNSQDSRIFGPITRSSVVGRVIVRVWPVGSAAWL